MRIFSLFPLVLVSDAPNERSNGSNKPGVVIMRPGGDAAVLAQELRESGLKLRYFVLPGLALFGAGIAAHALGLAGAVAPLAGFAAFLLSLLLVQLFPALQRWIELHGHETEVQAAIALYGAQEGEYRHREAQGMQAGYDGIFKDWTAMRVAGEMRARSGPARDYVRGRMALLERYKREVR